jgi:DNA-binding response OmpR family regulator
MEQAEAKKRILIVDDDAFLLDMYAMRFSQAGFEVETAMSAKEVLEKFHNGLNADIMLCDVVMPSTDGFELLEKMNKEELGKNLVKIFLSNLGQEQDIARGKSLGAVDYIVKANNTPSEVVAKVTEILKKYEL